MNKSFALLSLLAVSLVGGGGHAEHAPDPLDPPRVVDPALVGGSHRSVATDDTSALTASEKLLTQAVEQIVRRGSSPGTMNQSLCSAARDRVRELAKLGELDSHAGFLRKRAEYESAARPQGGLGEVLAGASTADTTPESAARACATSWRDSPKHREGITSPQYGYCYSMAPVERAGKMSFVCVGIIDMVPRQR